MDRGLNHGCGVVASSQTGFNRVEEQTVEQKAVVLAEKTVGCMKSSLQVM